MNRLPIAAAPKESGATRRPPRPNGRDASTLTAGRVIVDGRNGLDPAAWRAEGWTYLGMGRP